MSTSTYSVTGMTCAHCVASVTEEISEIAGARSVDVDLAGGAVTVTADGPIEDPAVHAAVRDAGYEVTAA